MWVNEAGRVLLSLPFSITAAACQTAATGLMSVACTILDGDFEDPDEDADADPEAWLGHLTKDLHDEGDTCNDDRCYWCWVTYVEAGDTPP